MDIVASLAHAWERSCAAAGPPHRRIISIAGLPGVGKTTCLDYLRRRSISANVIDEECFLSDEDILRAEDADKTLALLPGNSGLFEQTQIFFGAEMRRRAIILRDTSPVDWVLVCGGVDVTVLVSEILAHRGLIDIEPVQAAYSSFADVRTSAAVVLVARPEVLEDRIRGRIANTGQHEDRSEFTHLVSEVYLPWLQKIVPRVVVVNTTALTPEQVGEAVYSIIVDLTAP